MAPFMELHNISKVYPWGEGEVFVLNHISFTVEDGEFTAIVGESGSGKSTLMNILGCLDSPTGGEYFLRGQRVVGLRDKQLSQVRNKEIGFVFQGYHLIPTLTSLENVELPLLYREMGRKERRQRAVEALCSVGLGERLGHFPSQMSGGQQQRVAVARAIAADPKCILADEPTGNLDPQSTWEVMNVLRRLHRQGKTIVLITHDQAVAKSAKRIVGIGKGRLLFDKPGEGVWC